MPVPPEEWTQLIAAAKSADDRDTLLTALKAVQAHMEDMTEDLATLRQLRRELAEKLKSDYGHGGASWIAGELGVTPQAVNSFLHSAWKRK